MSANLEWDIPFTIRSSKGDLDLNVETSDGIYLLLKDGCEALRDLRVTVDEIPQADGQINHTRFTGGYEFQLQLALWTTRTQPACSSDARAMGEKLMLHLNALLNDTAGRLLWSPTGLGDERLMDQARLRELASWEFGPAGDPRITFRLDSPFPYVIDSTQLTATLVDGVPQPITNQGNVDFWPVVKVNGPATDFTLANVTLDQQIVYDSSLPGAVAIGSGDYLEFDFFRNTAYMNGIGASGKPGIDMELSDFWPLQAGVANTIEVTGADADMLYNHAYA